MDGRNKLPVCVFTFFSLRILSYHVNTKHRQHVQSRRWDQPTGTDKHPGFQEERNRGASVSCGSGWIPMLRPLRIGGNEEMKKMRKQGSRHSGLAWGLGKDKQAWGLREWVLEMGLGGSWGLDLPAAAPPPAGHG